MIPPRNGVLITPLIEQLYLQRKAVFMLHRKDGCLSFIYLLAFLSVWVQIVNLRVISMHRSEFVIYKSASRVLVVGVAPICD